MALFPMYFLVKIETVVEYLYYLLSGPHINSYIMTIEYYSFVLLVGFLFSIYFKNILVTN